MTTTRVLERSPFVVAFALIAGGASMGCQLGADVDSHVAAVTDPHVVPGAIFTTLVDGSRVNHNIYEDKLDVYLDGGPGINAPVDAAGLPAGDYYFQVTDPSGKDLLSSDHVSCRRIHVNDAGVIDLVYPGTDYVRLRGGWLDVPCQHEWGVDQDHPEDGAITVQLYPFDDTPNKGGVYKVWATPVDEYTGNPALVPSHPRDAVNGENWQPGDAHGFVPAFSKTDNFKVERPGRPYVPPVLVVRKFHDRDVDAVQDEGEETVTGWLVAITDQLGASNTYYTTAEVTVTEGTWYVAEDTPPATVQTAAYLDGTLVSAYPGANPLVAVEVAGDSEETHEVVYGNVGLGDVDACKGYDVDGDGDVTGAPPVVGWRFELVGVTVRGDAYGPAYGTTGPDGCAHFAGLLPGDYTVTELFPPGTEWEATGPTHVDVTVTSTLVGADVVGSHAEVWFANRCVGHADFDTKGYWHNKNGLDELADTTIELANGLAPYAAPSTYFEAGDEPFDGTFEDGTPVAAAFGSWGDEVAPAGSARAEVSHFLVDANAGGDPHEQLAQQLLAYTFNVVHRLDGPGAVIVLPDGTEIAAGALIDLAVEAWTGGTTDPGVVADLLDALNNSDDLRFVYQEPCPVYAP